MSNDPESPDFQKALAALRRAQSYAEAIDQIPVRSSGWKGRLERAVKKLFKWLVHWNTRPQADFNRLLVESVASLLAEARSEAERSADHARCLEDRIIRVARYATELAKRAGVDELSHTMRQELCVEEDVHRTDSETGGVPSPSRIRRWIEDSNEWPTADSYDLSSLEPCAVLARREAALKEQAPEWFWRGEAGATMLSVGSGKAYFERKYWRDFNKVFVVDPSQLTYHGLVYYPVANVEYLGGSIFNLSPRFQPLPKYAWLGACVHYLFDEFHGWEFMQKLAMMVSDTLIVDAGVFDRDSTQGKYLLQRWEEREPYQKHRRLQFTFDAFLRSIQGLWEVVSECETPWIADGRRSLVLKRVLPPLIQRSQLGPAERVSASNHVDSLSVYRTGEGYFKESATLNSLLMYHVTSHLMGWSDMVRWRVYDGDGYCGFVIKDYGDETPDDVSISEGLLMAVLNWSLPLGLYPADVARPNIRMYRHEPVWIDVTLVGLREMDARGALWAATNTYKLYDRIPARAGRVFNE